MKPGRLTISEVKILSGRNPLRQLARWHAAVHQDGTRPPGGLAVGVSQPAPVCVLLRRGWDSPRSPLLEFANMSNANMSNAA